MSGELKACTNCTRAPQPISQFLSSINGKPCKTCLKCRDKGKKSDARPERKEYHEEIMDKMRESGYWVEYEKGKKNEEIPEKEHDLNQKCEWSKNEKTKERLSLWKRLNIHDRVGSSRRQAIKKGIAWNLSDEAAGEMLILPCVYCGHLDLEVRLNGIDRLDSAKSYTVENCRPCCKNCNYMKGTFDPGTFITWAKRIAACTAEFPDVATCEDHKRIHRVPKTEPETQTTPEASQCHHPQ